MIASIRQKFRKPPPQLPDIAPRIKDEDEDDEAYKPIDWAIVRRLLTWLKPFRKQYTLGISVGLVHLLLEMSSPLFMGWLIAYVTSYATGALDPAFGNGGRVVATQVCATPAPASTPVFPGRAEDVLVDSQGRIVVAGTLFSTSGSTPSQQPAVWRFLPTGRAEPACTEVVFAIRAG